MFIGNMAKQTPEEQKDGNSHPVESAFGALQEVIGQFGKIATDNLANANERMDSQSQSE